MAQESMASMASKMTTNDGVSTLSWREQVGVEFDIAQHEMERQGRGEEEIVLTDQHVKYLQEALSGLGPGFTSLDASQPWLVYWTVHAMDLLGRRLDENICAKVAITLDRCQDRAAGGFGGGPGQRPHLASTYAAVSALVIVNRLDVVEKSKLAEFVAEHKDRETGGFRMTKGGEVDARGTYCALASASLTGTITSAITEGCVGFLTSLQSFDGGIAAERGNEAHGGYTYCGLAAAHILKEFEDVQLGSVFDLSALRRWLCMRQLAFEGGFQGRPNKLVDSCYSFWLGACYLLVPNMPPFNASRLAHYIIAYCQDPTGGLRDKLSKPTDLYHTCYALSGLACANQGDVAHKHLDGRTLSPVFNILEDRLGRLSQSDSL